MTLTKKQDNMPDFTNLVWIETKKLHFGDTLWMPTDHTIHGESARGYMFVGWTSLKGEERRLPVLCTLKTAGGEGPTFSNKPTTWSLPETALYREHPKNSNKKGIDALCYYAGQRCKESNIAGRVRFVNLCELVVIHLPLEHDLLLADMWCRGQLEITFRKVFREELEHWIEKHDTLWQLLCQFYTVTQGPQLGRLREEMNRLLKIEKENLKYLRRFGNASPNVKMCSDTKCGFVERIVEAFTPFTRNMGLNQWSRSTGQKLGHSFPSADKIGNTHPLALGGYKRLQFAPSSACPLTRKRWQELIRPNPYESAGGGTTEVDMPLEAALNSYYRDNDPNVD